MERGVDKTTGEWVGSSPEELRYGLFPQSKFIFLGCTDFRCPTPKVLSLEELLIWVENKDQDIISQYTSSIYRKIWSRKIHFTLLLV